ncbi:ZIP family metal transporter [Roseovarius pelagicus]|uniref:Divalent cation transporter n=1 Tax=Roseovarius pelagicus TaxID=2980108 RepID=A0ABY6DLJ0_9RHOB|nr:divalent cation transporter [Roseovarius pelagicus]UXX84635.1 divalent cation transporter [Roseovarius pelagicus]
MAETLTQALLLAGMAGATIPVGALLATQEKCLPGWLEDEFRHSVIAFGGGALFSAIALVLVPEGADRLAPLAVLFWFVAGGAFFCCVDRAIQNRGGTGAQLMAMLLDFVPEAMALGALIAGDPGVAVLMAGLIALQNLPEGFNAFREMQDAGRRTARILILFVMIVALGPISAWFGLTVLGDQPEVLGAIMLFAAGGILYLLFEDIAPGVRLERAWAPPLGAVAGFALGLAGHLMVA